jgi:hypothetical protein
VTDVDVVTNLTPRPSFCLQAIVTLIFESAFQLSKQTYQVEALLQEALLKEDYYDLGN